MIVMMAETKINFKKGKSFENNGKSMFCVCEPWNRRPFVDMFLGFSCLVGSCW